MARAPIEKTARGEKERLAGRIGRADNATDRATERGGRDEEEDDDKGGLERRDGGEKTRRTGRTRGREDDSRAPFLRSKRSP